MRRGWTAKPCEGCGRKSQRFTASHSEPTYGWEREQGAVCHECVREREEGRAAITELARVQKTEGETLWRWTEANYAWPTYRAVRSHCGADGEGDALSKAMWTLVGGLSRPAPADAPTESRRYEMRERTGFDPPGRGKVRDYLPWPRLIGADEDWDRRDSGWGCLVLCRPTVRAQLLALDEAIRAALNAGYEDGKALGGSVLRSLASGAMSMDDFDETLERRQVDETP